MKICPKCNTQIDDDSIFCSICGTSLNGEQPIYTPPVTQFYDPYDHTSEFDAEDISQNKIFAMASYLLSGLGIVIALLGAPKSEFVGFHVRQSLKILILEILLGLLAAVACFTVIVPVVAGVLCVALAVVQIICFFQVANGKAIEPAIVRNIGFLK